MKEYEELIQKLTENMLEPMPDIEAVRFYWDEEAQSVKHEIVPLSNIRKPETSDGEAK